MAKPTVERVDEAEQALDAAANNLKAASRRLEQLMEFTKLVHEAYERRQHSAPPPPGRPA